MKKTKIICSIGPASCSSDVMSQMVKNGMNVARINFSHATKEEKENVVASVKKVRKLTGEHIAILYDTKGPEFRNGLLENDFINLEPNQTIRIVKEKVLGDSTRFSVNHPEALNSLEIGNSILLENGLMEIIVISKEEDGVTCRVVTGGILGNKKSLSVPGVHLNIPFISENDMEDIIYACKNDADFLALSFVSTKEDVLAVRDILRVQKREDLKIVAKIESVTGIENLESIVEVSDGIMVARGDLGVEEPMEELPILQKKIIDMCHRKGKFCIVATEMLESMKKNIRPTRAEVSDVANAVIDGADAVMLSGETTTGNYPIETVKYMANICKNTEGHLEHHYNVNYVDKSIDGIIANNVVETSELLDVKLIVATTISGLTPTKISNLRPRCPIFAPCPSEAVARGLMLNWGVYPTVTQMFRSTDEILRDAVEKAHKFMPLFKNDVIVITGGLYDNNEHLLTNFMKIEKI